MTTPEDLLARVEAAYAERDLPSWPDPHPDGGSPQVDEYSRYTDAPRYRIAHERGRAWARVLEDLGATVEPVEVDGARAGGLRITSPLPRTVPLLLLEHEHEHELDSARSVLPYLVVAVGHVDVLVDQQPYCGCDACDDGSARLLGEIDEAVLPIVSGPSVVLRHPDWHARWHTDGARVGRGSGSPGLHTTSRWCRELHAGGQPQLPEGTTAYVGSSWLR